MLIASFIGILLLTLAIGLLLSRPKNSEKTVQRTLEIITTTRKSATEDGELEPVAKERQGLADRMGRYVEQFGFAEDLRKLIMHAGSTATVGSVVSTSLMAAVGCAAVAHLILGEFGVDFLVFMLGASSRWGMLKFQKSKRMKKFNTVLADAIELVARALRAGHSITSAIEVVAEQSAEPLASEFAIVFQQQKFGLPFRDAMCELGDRVPSKDLHFLITAILVQRETGGDLTEILDRTTRVIRERVRIEGEIRTYTAQGRLTGWILAALPVVMLILISFITPSYSTILFHDPLGQKLLYVGATMIIIGGLIIRKIVNIRV